MVFFCTPWFHGARNQINGQHTQVKGTAETHFMWCTYVSTWFYLWKSGKSSLCWCFKYVFSYLNLFELWLFFELLIHWSIYIVVDSCLSIEKCVGANGIRYVWYECALAASSVFLHHRIRTTFQCGISTFTPKDLVTYSVTFCAMFDNIESTYLEFMKWIALRLIPANVFWTESYPSICKSIRFYAPMFDSQSNSLEWLWMHVLVFFQIKYK